MASKKKISKSIGNNKIRVNITVDKEMLDEAKRKLHLFGGKLSTLFNAYLADFVSSIDKKVGSQINKDKDDILKRLRELENKIKEIEKSEKDKDKK